MANSLPSRCSATTLKSQNDTVDLRAGLEFGNYRFDALARNIGNTVGITGYRSAAGFNGETGQAAIVQPRSFILRISGQF